MSLGIRMWRQEMRSRKKIICTSEPKEKAEPTEAEQMVNILPPTMVLLPGLTLGILVSFFFFFFFFFFFKVYLFLRERKRDYVCTCLQVRKEQREAGHRGSKADSTLTAETQMQGSNSNHEIIT